MPEPTTVALVLGGGGARGYAHIGVLEVLEERGYQVVAIAGTSMGALVGGLHAAGARQAYADWACGLTQRDVLRLLDPTIRGPGAIRANKIFAKVTELLGDVRIEDLPVPYTAVATDLLAGKEVWFQHGPLAPAIRASIALPSFITPVMLDGRLLADGGMLNPIPVAATVAANADLTVAVSLSEEHVTGHGSVTTTASADPRPTATTDPARPEPAQLLDSELVRAVTSWFGGFRDTGAATSTPNDDADTPDPVDASLREFVDGTGLGAPPPGLRMIDVMQLSLDALQGAVTRYRLAGYPPDVLVTIPRTACRTLDFHRAEELIALGRRRAEAALERDTDR